MEFCTACNLIMIPPTDIVAIVMYMYCGLVECKEENQAARSISTIYNIFSKSIGHTHASFVRPQFDYRDNTRVPKTIQRWNR